MRFISEYLAGKQPNLALIARDEARLAEVKTYSEADVSMAGEKHADKGGLELIVSLRL